MSNETLFNQILNEAITYVKSKDEFINEFHNHVQQESANGIYDTGTYFNEIILESTLREHLFPNSDKNEERFEMIEYGKKQRHVPVVQELSDE